MRGIVSCVTLLLELWQGGEAKKKDDNVSRPRSVFELSRRLNDPEKQELAWGTYSLLQNSRASAVVSQLASYCKYFLSVN